MPSSQTFRMPAWVPLAIIGVSAIAIVLSIRHMSKRMKARWPW